MSNWLNFGHTDPLTLHMAHPLAERLEIMARPKASRLAGLGVTLACLMGGIALTAPLAAAENHPYKGLTDAEETSLPTMTVMSESTHKSDGKEIYMRVNQKTGCDAKVSPKTTHSKAKASYADTLIHIAQSLETPLGFALVPNSNFYDALDKEIDHV